MNNKKYRILDLFCGAGGFSFGLDSLNEFETKIGLDFDKNAIKTFERMFPEAEAICGDITSDKLKNYIIEKSLIISQTILMKYLEPVYDFTEVN
jgi:site-specific DNA-cytosine methylase